MCVFNVKMLWSLVLMGMPGLQELDVPFASVIKGCISIGYFRWVDAKKRMFLHCTGITV